MKNIFRYVMAGAVGMWLLTHVPMGVANQEERKRLEKSDHHESNATFCYGFVNKRFARAYINPPGKERPEKNDLVYSPGDGVDDYLWLNKQQCEQLHNEKLIIFVLTPIGIQKTTSCSM